MERLSPDSPLAAVLRANRARANAAVARARRTNARIDPASIATFLCGPLDRLVRSIAAARPDRAPEAAEALFEMATELFRDDLLGSEARCPAVVACWDRVLPALAPLLADDPRRLAASVSNLVFNLEREQPGAGLRWIDAILPVAAACRTPAELLDAGLVVAWRSGLAHYRQSALDRWRQLPDHVRRASLGLPPTAGEPALSAMEDDLEDPWWRPGDDTRTSSGIRLVARVGGFRLFGGAFVRPPRVASVQGSLVAFDRTGCHVIHADCYGATLRRVGDGPPASTDRASHDITISTAGVVSGWGRTAAFSDLRDATSFASTRWTLAVTLRHSHQVHLVAVTAGGDAR